jgi:hypothetical protein
MRRGLMRRSIGLVSSLLILVAALTTGAGRAEAITLAEIMQLTKAGLNEEVLLALIEVDQRVFAIDPDTLKQLKDAGVSPRVIVAIVKSGRIPPPQAEPAVPPEDVRLDPPDPQVVVVDRPVIHEVPVAVPVYVAVCDWSRGRHRDRTATTYRPTLTLPPTPPSTVSPLVDRPEPRKRAEPIYWGWGGKLRPDAWQPTPKK